LQIIKSKKKHHGEKETLADLIKELQGLDYDVSFTGFSPPEIDELFTQLHAKDVNEDDFDVEEALKEPTMSKQGDLWLLGKHRLLCGDSTKAETYDVLMDGKKANLVVTDPPYGISYEGSQGKIKNDDFQGEEFYKFLLAAFKNLESAMSDDASIYVFHADTKGIFFRRAFEDAGFHLSGVCQWVKQSLVLGRSPYQWKHEPCLYGFKKKGKHKWYSGRKETTVWEFDRPSKSALHSTMKPVALCAYPIKNSTAVNSIVLEPFSGSASTLIACEQIDRICFAIEIEERFVDVGVKRFIDNVGTDKDVFLIRDGKKIHYADVVLEVKD
jgi:DNA modification methylase